MKERRRAILQNRIRTVLRNHKMPSWNRRDMREALDRLEFVTVGISGGDLASWVRVTAHEFYGRYKNDNGIEV
jgi:hypothetical protein